MKKFSLAVTNACHENWDVMTPEQKGRFCASCKKIVVDFSSMTDRQLTEFFAKPAGNLCGRFHTDQLNRSIALPSKGATWLKPFFHLTWPAFLLVLKSSAQKDKTGSTTVIETVHLNAMHHPDSNVSSAIVPVDPAAKKRVAPSAIADTSIKNKVVSDTVGKDTPASKNEPFIMGMVTFKSYKEKKASERKEELRKERETKKS